MTPKNTPDRTPATTDNTPALPDAPMLRLVAADDEWGDVETIDLAPATAMRIPHVQVNRRLDGGITDPTTGEIGREMWLILLGHGQSRAQWDEPFDGKTAGPPQCRSFDAVMPDGASPLLKANHCATCPYNVWEATETVQKHQRCKLSEQWLAFVLDPLGEGGQYARIRWGGLAATPAANYWASFKLRKPEQRPCSVITRVDLIETRTDNNTVFVPQFRRAAQLARADVAPLLADLPALRAAFAGAVAESVATGEDDTAPAAEGRAAPSHIDPETGEFVEYDKPMGGEQFAAQMTGQASAYAAGEEPF